MTIDVATIGVEFDTSSVKAGNAALDATTVAGNRAADSLDAMGTRSATSLSKLASVADLLRASLAGISAAALVRELYSADVALNSIKSTLGVALGPQAAAGLEFVRAEADRLGLSLQSTAQSFAEFEAASIGTALQGKKAADVFSAVAEATTALHLPVQQTNSLFLALQQMLSKGTVQAQELHLQFGQAIPGAMGLAARAMGVTTAELNKMIASGSVLSTDFLPKLADELHKTFGDASLAASNNLLANVNRLETAFTNLKQGVNEAGMSEALNGAARSLTELVNVANANIGPIIKVSEAIAAVFVARSAAPIIVQLVATTQAMTLQAASTLRSAEAEAIYQAALMKSAENSLLKARAVEAAAAAEVASLVALVDATQAEAKLEAIRITAQISEQGRTASLARMTEASVAAAGATELLAVAERNLAAAQAGVAAASATAAATAATATTAVTAAGLSARAAAAGVGLLRGAMGLLGGPVGVAITGLSLLYIWFNQTGDAAAKAGDGIAKSLHDAAEEARRLQYGGPILGKEQLAQINEGRVQIERITGTIADLTKQREAYIAKGDNASADEFTKNILALQGIAAQTADDINVLTGAAGNLFDAQSGKANKATEDLRKNNAELLLAIQLTKQGTTAKNAPGNAKLLLQGVDPSDIANNNAYKKTLDDITKAEDDAAQAVKRHADEIRSANEGAQKKLDAYTTENALISQGITLEEARMRGDLASKGVTQQIIDALVKKDAAQRALIQHADDAKTITTLGEENKLILAGVDALNAKARAAVIAANAPRGPEAVKAALADLEAVQAASKHTEALEKVSDAANSSQRAQEAYAVTAGAANELLKAGVINQDQYTQALYNADTARAQASGSYAEQALQLSRVNELVAKGLTLEQAQAEVSARSAGATKEQADALAGLQKIQDSLTGADLAAPFQSLQDTLNQLSTTWGRASANVVTGFSAIAQAAVKTSQINGDAAKKNGQYSQDQIEQLTKLKAQTLGGYGSMAAGLQSFFKEGSKGYKALGAASQVFYAAEIALNLATITAKLLGTETVTTAKVVGDAASAESATTSAGVQVAAATAVGEANALAAVAGQGTGDPYTAFPRIAAMAALMAGLGFIVGGLGGGGDSYSANQQAKQGTGTVLGDPTAKSDSIAKGIDELGKLETGVLSYSQRMLAQLTDINAGINGLGSLLIQANLATGGNTPFTSVGGITGIASAIIAPVNGLNKILSALPNALGKIPYIGQISNLLGGNGLNQIIGLGNKVTTAIFGGKQSLSDTGINLKGTVGDYDASYYARIRTSGGLFSGPSYNNKYANLDAQTADQIGKVIGGLDAAVIEGISALGGDAAKAKALIDKMNLDIGNISLKGLKGEDVQKALTAVFSALGDRMAATAGAALSNIDLTQFQQVGEGLLTTLSRVAVNFEYAKEAAAQLGVTLVPLTNDFAASADVAGDLIKASVAASETANGLVSGLGQLVNGFNGSADDLVTYIKALYQARTSLSEVRINTAALTATLVNAAGGIDALQSSLSAYQDAFFSDSEKAAAKTQTMTDAFAKLGLTLPDSYGAFRKLVDGIDTGTDAGQQLLGQVLSLASGFDDLQQSLDAANQAQQQLQKTLDDAVGSNALPEQKLGDLMAQFDNAYAMALSSSGIDLQNQANALNDLIGPLVDSIRNVYASGDQANALTSYVSSAVEAVIAKLGSGSTTLNASPSQVTSPGANQQTSQSSSATSDAGSQAIVQQLEQQNTNTEAVVTVTQAGFQQLIALVQGLAQQVASLESSNRLQAQSA